MRKLRAFTLIELLIVVAIIAILAAIAVPNFLEAQVRSKVSRVRSDMRSLATGLESYYIDNNQYPAMWGPTVGGLHNVNSAYFGVTPPPNATRTFRLRNTTQLSTLTTPIAYLTSFFGDPFSDTRGVTFSYFTDGPGWILGSWGPDTDEREGGDLLMSAGATVHALDREADTVETIYISNFAQPSTLLITGTTANNQSGPPARNNAFTYDPTNGTVTEGDVWRVKQ